MPVTLQNRLRQMQVFNLDHAAYCGPTGCACIDTTVTVSVEDPRTGERRPRQLDKKIPQSLTLLALERRTELPDTVLDVSEVRAAIDAGTVRVLAQPPVAPASAQDGAGTSSVSNSAPSPGPANQGIPENQGSAASAATVPVSSSGERA